MKGLILAGGYARRLAPITDFIAKPLLPVGGKPIIEWIVEKISNAGINEIIISTNSYYQSQFEYWIKCMKYKDIVPHLLIEPTTKEEEKFGAIKGIKYAMDKFGKDEYLVVAGDNFFDFSLKDLVNFYRVKKSPVIAVYDVGHKEKAKRYGVVSLDSESRVIEMEEKPKTPKTTWISTACYVFPPRIYEMLEAYLNDNNNPDSPGYFISWLSKKIPVYGLVFRGAWHDIGNIDEYRTVFSTYLSV